MVPTHNLSGFYKAPVIKAFLISTLAASLSLLFLQAKRHIFLYDTSAIFERFQVWRIATSKIAYLDVKDILVSSLLLYYFRIFERRFGSRKFVSFLLGTLCLNICLELMSVYLLKLAGFKFNILPSGPLCVIYALFIPYYCDVPRVALGHIMGIPVTGKSFQYFMGLQLASGSLENLLVAACGLISGVLWRINFMHIQTITQVPEWLASMIDRHFGSVIASNPPKDYNSPFGATLEIQQQEHMDRLEQQLILQSLNQQHRAHQNAAQNFVPGLGMFGNVGLRQRLGQDGGNQQNNAPISEEQVQQLVAMGFDAERARNALRTSNNDFNIATNILLQDS